VTVSVGEREWVAVALELKVVLRVSVRVVETVAVVDTLDDKVVFMVSERETLIPDVAERFSDRDVFIVSPTFIFTVFVTVELMVELTTSEMETVGEVLTVPVRVAVMLSETLTP